MFTGKRPAALLSLLTVLALSCALALSGATGASAAASSAIVSPLPGTVSAMPASQISFLGASAASLSSISVTGSASGRHSGHLHSYSSATGASFIPSAPFTPGERVTVHAIWRTPRGARTTLSTSFTVAQPAVVSFTEFPAVPGTPADVQSFNSQPALHPPAITVHQAAGATSAPGYVFAAPFLGPGQWGPMIFDSAGNLVWFHQVPTGQDAADLRTQVLHGKNDLTWWQGRTIQLGYGLGVDVVADANYHTVAVIHAGNGLQADEHEFNVTPQGTAWVLAYSPVTTSLASVGGPASGTVVEGVIQEVDIHTGLVMWEWHSLGRIDLTESYSKLPASPAGAYDYFHINSLTTDAHGNVLISARNTWGLYDINHHSGAVMWRLGGKRSTFKLGQGVQFAFQHNALWLPNGDISLFDDEGAPPVNPPSRGEVVRLDTAAKTATLVSQFVRNPGPLTTGSQGDLQALPGGNWMVGWGGLPNFTEFNAQGQVVYDGQLPHGEFSYRVYRLPWAGQPTEPPAVVARSVAGTSTVYASWNGATTVFSWQLLTGSSAAHMTAVSTTPRSGFETTIPAPAAAIYEVRALSASGRVLGTSTVVSPVAG
jgi:hypothetical protein